MEVQNQINANQHPKELYVLFFTEMWERFSYYGMRSLLILYLIQYLHYTEKFAGQLYGVYTGMVYLTPIIGGLVADRWIGHKKAVYLGGLLMAFGHLSIAFDSVETLYIGLGLLILGNGFFKPNISTILGDLYTMQPHLKDAGFTIFYMGINLGAFAGPILCGYLGEKLGWHYGFGAAGIGMILGLAQFHFFSKSGEIKSNTPLPNKRNQKEQFE